MKTTIPTVTKVSPSTISIYHHSQIISNTVFIIKNRLTNINSGCEQISERVSLTNHRKH